MKAIFNNIGVIKKAEILLDGLSVITGFNDSGKSTVGKALYSLYHGMNFYQQSIEIDLLEYLMEPFDLLRNEQPRINVRLFLRIRQFLRRYVGSKHFGSECTDRNADRVNTTNNINELFKTSIANNVDREVWEKVQEEFMQRLNKSEEPRFQMQIKKNVVHRFFQTEFGGQIENVYNKGEQGSIFVENGENERDQYEVQFLDGDIIGIERNIPQGIEFKDVVLIDNPTILNDLNEYSRYPIQRRILLDHKNELLSKLVYPNDVADNNIVRAAIFNEMKQGFITKIGEILTGTIEIDEEKAIYHVGRKKFDLSVLASGLKSYVIIRRLIDNGYLTENNLLVIDEPEVHLHPAWQIHFAEILILLQKEIGIKMILTTHSPYFLQALDIFSKRHGINTTTHFYLAQRQKNGATVKMIDGHIDETYNLLAKPILDLRDMMDQVGDGE